MPKNPRKPFKTLGTSKTAEDLRPQTTFISTRQIDQKTIRPLAPTRAPKTNTHQLLRKVEANHFRLPNLARCVGMSNHLPLCSCSVTRLVRNPTPLARKVASFIERLEAAHPVMW